MIELIDRRIAATRGVAVRGGKGGYIWPGMATESDWRKTKVHQHTHQYSCGHCGQAFGSPHAVYTHMAKSHGK